MPKIIVKKKTQKNTRKSTPQTIKPEILEQIDSNPRKYAENVTISELVQNLQILSDVYYNTGNSLVDDATFDMLREVLEERDPKNKFLKNVGAPIKVEKEKVKLPYPMGSLNKIKPEKENLQDWLDKYKGPYILSDKMDGISAQLYKKSANEYKLYTRGDGLVGQDISNLVPYIITNDSIKLDEIPIDTSIRGEIIMSKKNFETISGEMKNARNAVGGIVNSKTEDATFKKLAKLCDFITYEIIHPRLLYQEQFKLLEKYNFKVAKHRVEKNISYDMLSEYLKDRRKNGEYEIDGIVVADGSKIHEHVEGYPDFAFAFKTVLDDQIAITTVVRVIWDASMDGYLKPRIEIVPVQITGTTVTYATAFNAKFVEENKLGPGAKVKLVRSGDVIPHIMEVIKPATSDKPQMPDIPYVWTPTHVDIIVQDLYGAQNDVITVKRLTFFFKSIDAKYISEGIITKLVNAGYKSVKDILSADKDKLSEIDGIGDKLVNKIFDSIHEALKNVGLAQFMAATHIFGRGLGERKIKEILKTYPNIMNEKWDNKTFLNNILKINGFSTITATKFCDNFKEFKEFLNELNTVEGVDLSHLTKKVEIKPEDENEDENEIDLSGKSFVFTGFRDKTLEEKIEELGGKVKTSVSKNTTAVVKPDDSEEKSSKLGDADTYKVKILTKSEFIDQYNL
jgi:NAD-dependent DNA ligase